MAPGPPTVEDVKKPRSRRIIDVDATTLKQLRAHRACGDRAAPAHRRRLPRPRPGVRRALRHATAPGHGVEGVHTRRCPGGRATHPTPRPSPLARDAQPLVGGTEPGADSQRDRLGDASSASRSTPTATSSPVNKPRSWPRSRYSSTAESCSYQTATTRRYARPGRSHDRCYLLRRRRESNPCPGFCRPCPTMTCCPRSMTWSTSVLLLSRPSARARLTPRSHS